MKLIATWLKNQEPARDAPHSVLWGDVHPVTLEEYRAHIEDTKLCVALDDGRFEWHYFPDVDVTVFYCQVGRVWGIRGDGIEPASLYVTDPSASDMELYWALGALPIWYQAKIVRPNPQALFAQHRAVGECLDRSFTK
jgi:hypothetical protein